MDLQPYVDAVRHELKSVATAGGEVAADLADRLSAPLESALRLALLEALSAAAEEITGELAPGSVEVRLRGRDPEFIVSAPPVEQVFDQADERAVVARYDDDGGTWRVTLRLPEGLRAAVEGAAHRDGASLNSWLVRVAAAASHSTGHGVDDAVPGRPAHRNAHRLTGWAR
jgi:hypothetical protein